MSEHISTKINIVVGEEVVGVVQSVDISDSTDKTKLDIRAGRIRFDRKRIEEVFNHGSVSAKYQCSPLKLVMEDNFIGYSVVTSIENCWIESIPATYIAYDLVIAQDVQLSANVDDASSKTVVDKTSADLRKAEDERIWKEMRENLASGKYKRFCTKNEESVTIKKGRSVGKSTELDLNANDGFNALSVFGTRGSIISSGSVKCKKCGGFMEHCAPSEPDGTHICHKCR